MRTALMALAIGLLPSVTSANSYDFATAADVFREIDRTFPNLDANEYTRLIDRAGELTPLQGGIGGRGGEIDRYRRCYDVWRKVQEAFAHLDAGVAYLTHANNQASSAAQEFSSAVSTLGYAQRDWHAGAKDSCGERDAQRQFTFRIMSASFTLPIESWMEKAKQLGGLADERQSNGNHKVPSLARIKEAPRATASAVAGSLPPKYVDNPQYVCGSLPAWQKTVSKSSPAGDPTLLPGCAKLDDDEEGGATVQVLSRSKKLVMELADLDKTGGDSDWAVRQMTEKLERLARDLARGVWKTPELDPMAQSFERLHAWETNEMKAIATRRDIGFAINSFSRDFNEKTGKFSGKFYDIYLPNAQKCIDLVQKAQSDGVDVDTTNMVPAVADAPVRTYAAALALCQSAKGGMAAKKKADIEAAAAEDLKWKTLCGGDKYKLWKAHGQYALSRGGWDQSRPEQACKADVWWGHYGPDDNQVYDCDKYTFAGSKQTGHTRKSNRWFMACP